MRAGGCSRTAQGRPRLGRASRRRSAPSSASRSRRASVDSRRRFSETAGEELLLVTVPVVDGGEVVGAVRVSASRESVVDRVHRAGSAWPRSGLPSWPGPSFSPGSWRPRFRGRSGGCGDTAGQLGGGDLDARAPTDGPAELAALGVSFNRMADALGSSMRAQRDFVANASHQLRTPLTGIKLRLEAIRADGGTAGENAARAEEELDRLEAARGRPPRARRGCDRALRPGRPSISRA